MRQRRPAKTAKMLLKAAAAAVVVQLCRCVFHRWVAAIRPSDASWARQFLCMCMRLSVLWICRSAMLAVPAEKRHKRGSNRLVHRLVHSHRLIHNERWALGAFHVTLIRQRFCNMTVQQPHGVQANTKALTVQQHQDCGDNEVDGHDHVRTYCAGLVLEEVKVAGTHSHFELPFKILLFGTEAGCTNCMYQSDEE